MILHECHIFIVRLPIVMVGILQEILALDTKECQCEFEIAEILNLSYFFFKVYTKS